MRSAAPLPFCAICTDEARNLRLEPLGKNGAMVRVCMSCSEVRPRHIGPSDRGYEPTGGFLSAGHVKHLTRQLTAAGDKEPRGNTIICRPVALGYTIVRVPRRARGGKDAPQDWQTALRTLKSEPWYRSVRMLGSDARFFLFERPLDPKTWLADNGTDFDPHVATPDYHGAQPEDGSRGGTDGSHGRRNRRKRK